jgi:hypothetical protein
MVAHAYGNTVVVIGVHREKEIVIGKQYSGKGRFTDTWIKVGSGHADEILELSSRVLCATTSQLQRVLCPPWELSGLRPTQQMPCGSMNIGSQEPRRGPAQTHPTQLSARMRR